MFNGYCGSSPTYSRRYTGHFRSVRPRRALNETIDAQRDLLTTALEANLSLISVARTSNDRRGVAAMIAVPTMIGGLRMMQTCRARLDLGIRCHSTMLVHVPAFTDQAVALVVTHVDS